MFNITFLFCLFSEVQYNKGVRTSTVIRSNRQGNTLYKHIKIAAKPSVINIMKNFHSRSFMAFSLEGKRVEVYTVAVPQKLVLVMIASDVSKEGDRGYIELFFGGAGLVR